MKYMINNNSCQDNFLEWIYLIISEAMIATKNRSKWREIVKKSTENRNQPHGIQIYGIG